MLILILLFGLTETTSAYESFTATISFYQGFTISSGMTELDPIVITIIIGDAEEIEIISSPDLSPLFEFTPQVDLYFGLTTDPDDPIEVIAEQIAGMAVLEDTAFEDVTDDLLSTLDFMEQIVTIQEPERRKIYETDQNTTIRFSIRAVACWNSLSGATQGSSRRNRTWGR